MRKILSLLYSVYAMLLFVLLLLIIFPFVLPAAFLGKLKGGNWIYRVCCFWADTWFLLIGMWAPITWRSRRPLPQEQFIFVANHISYMDVPMIVKCIRRPLRALGKAELSKVPVFGFLYRYTAILVDRSDPEKRKKSVVQLKSVLRNGISIFIFPEGTFNMGNTPLKDFFDGAFRIAIETQTPLYPVVFPDTLQRLHYQSIFSFTPGKCRAIFLEPVPVGGLQIEDLPALKESVYRMMEQALADSRDKFKVLSS